MDGGRLGPFTFILLAELHNVQISKQTLIVKGNALTHSTTLTMATREFVKKLHCTSNQGSGDDSAFNLVFL